ncbi:hypothetical protein PV416_01115 [Streptomyces ipomoeae]|uniref:hypothetical protein n=1 Tax=Streptomyces ipomoeae TaxID=103232 RepID=UPI0015F02A05|nr:hypothetical protein [Streptomyces ipomoeae]MDX2819717.1 hypothetical protein [Streptomyces ipomoeae]
MLGGRGTLRVLRIAMWVLIAVAVPVWLVRIGYLTEQHRLPEATSPAGRRRCCCRRPP